MIDVSRINAEDWCLPAGDAGKVDSLNLRLDTLVNNRRALLSRGYIEDAMQSWLKRMGVSSIATEAALWDMLNNMGIDA